MVSDSVRPHRLQPIRLLRPWDFPGKSTGVGCHCLLWRMSIDNSKSFTRKLFFFKQSGWEIGYQVQVLFRIIERSVMMAKLLPTANPQVCFLKEVGGSGLFWSEGRSSVIEKSSTNWVSSQNTELRISLLSYLKQWLSPSKVRRKNIWSIWPSNKRNSFSLLSFIKLKDSLHCDLEPENNVWEV